MLSSEEKSLLENAKALISEIESMQEGEAMMEEGEEEEITMEMDEEKYEEDEFVKKQEGSTASDDADKRVEDLPEQTEENVDDVAKAIVKMLTRAPINKSVGRSKVRKAGVRSVSRNDGAVAIALSKLTKIVKSLADGQSEHEQALSSILDGLGVADAVKKAKVSDNQAIVAPDLAQVLMEVNKSLKGLNQGQISQEQPEQKNDRTVVRKNLAGALPTIFQVQK